MVKGTGEGGVGEEKEWVDEEEVSKKDRRSKR